MDEDEAHTKRQLDRISTLFSASLENFKAFKEPQYIPVKPITLVFGPNSSGKSSIIHALAFLKSVHASKGYCDRDIVDFGWSKVHLGSWLNLVYGHNPDASMKITLHFDRKDTITWTFKQGKEGPRVAEFLIEKREEPEKKGEPIARGENTSNRLIQWKIELHRSNPVWRTYKGHIKELLLNSPWQGEISAPFNSDFDQWLGQDWKTLPKCIDNPDEDPPIKYNELFPGILCNLDPVVELIRTSGTMFDEREGFEPELLLETLGKPNESRAYFDEKLSLFKWRALTNKMEVSFESQLYVGNDRNLPTGILTRRALPHSPAMKPWLTLIDNESDGYPFLTPQEELNRTLKSLEINYSVGIRLRKETIITGSRDKGEDPKEEDYVSQEELVFEDSNGIHHPIRALGSGIGKILPNLVAMASSQAELLILEEPENNIHPRLQTTLADVIIESSNIERGIRHDESWEEVEDRNDGHCSRNFLIETHSEHLILRILRRIRETTNKEINNWPDDLKRSCPEGITPDDIAVLYVSPTSMGSVVSEIRVTDKGKITGEWPGGFFEERLDELF